MAVSDYQQVFYFSDFTMISVTHQEEEETSHLGEVDTGVICTQILCGYSHKLLPHSSHNVNVFFYQVMKLDRI